MKSNLYRVLCAITALTLAAMACGAGGSTTPQPAPVQPAPEQTLIPVALPVSTEPVKIGPIPIGSNEILPPAATVIVLQVAPEDLQDVDEAMRQNEAGGFDAANAVFIGGLLQLVLKGLEVSWCASISDNFTNHLLAENAKRLRRAGGWTGVTNIVDALIHGRYEIKAILSSYSKWRVAFLMVIDGKDYVFILSTESASTVMPLAVLKSDLDDWLLNKSANFITINGGGQIVEGMVFGTREVASILHTGIYLLDAAMIAQTAVSFAKVGKCIDTKVRATESYKQWEANGKPNNGKVDVLYDTEYDLVMDIQILQNLGLMHNLTNNSAAERHGLLVISIAGMAVTAWVIAPVIIPAGAYFGISAETVRYALMIGTAVP